jgi:hypothetical protein
MENKEDRPIASLLSNLAVELTTLMRQELQLFKTEISEKLSRMGYGIALLGIGGALAFAGLLFLLEAMVRGLGYIMPLWLSALLVGGLVLIVGGILALKGKNNLTAENLAPERTVESLRRDKDLAKEQIRRT